MRDRRPPTADGDAPRARPPEKGGASRGVGRGMGPRGETVACRAAAAASGPREARSDTPCRRRVSRVKRDTPSDKSDSNPEKDDPEKDGELCARGERPNEPRQDRRRTVVQNGGERARGAGVAHVLFLHERVRVERVDQVHGLGRDARVPTELVHGRPAALREGHRARARQTQAARLS